MTTTPAASTSVDTPSRAAPAGVFPYARFALLLLTGVLYVWGLGASGWANTYYSAAVQAGTQSWTAFLFGASDAGNAITIDKTPASLWVMGLSARIFGLSSWSILVPQALIGVATVALVCAAVRRWYGPAAGLLAGAVTALTPVAVVMARFNNPDALLVLLLVAGAYATVRAVETGATRWLVLAGTFVGFGFLTKMLQALLVVPAFALVYLVAGPPRLRRRVGQLALAGLAVVLSAGWYVALVELLPASARPYIGGTQHNSLLELALGYNGMGRLTGGGGDWGTPGWGRMFDPMQGGQVSWLLPAALIVLPAGLVLTARAARTDRRRAGLLLWGGWLLTTGVVLSFMQGIFHAYYTVALVPAIGAVAGGGAVLLWRARYTILGSAALTAAIVVTAWWSSVLLGRSAGFLPPARLLVPVVGGIAALAVLGASQMPGRVATRIAAAGAGLALAAALTGPAAYAAETVSSARTGPVPVAGPVVAGGPAGARVPAVGFRGDGLPGGSSMGSGGPPTGPGGLTTTAGGLTTGPGGLPTDPGGSMAGAGGLTTGPGGLTVGASRGGLPDAGTVDAEAAALLAADADRYTWVAATVGSQSASGYQLAVRRPVLPVGGFNGTDPAPTLTQFQRHVSAGRIHYFIDTGPAHEITAWVAAAFPARTVGGARWYDLTAAP